MVLVGSAHFPRDSIYGLSVKGNTFVPTMVRNEWEEIVKKSQFLSSYLLISDKSLSLFGHKVRRGE